MWRERELSERVSERADPRARFFPLRSILQSFYSTRFREEVRDDNRAFYSEMMPEGGESECAVWMDGPECDVGSFELIGIILNSIYLLDIYSFSTVPMLMFAMKQIDSIKSVQ